MTVRIGLSIMSLAVVSAWAQPTPPTSPTPPTPPRVRSVQRLSVTTDGGSYLGVGTADVDSARAKALKLKEERGAEITKVYEDSPAAKAGFKDGDVVLEFNGQAVQGTEQLARMVRETPPGRQVKVVVWRNGSNETLTATVETRKNEVAAPFAVVVPRFNAPQFTMPDRSEEHT